MNRDQRDENSPWAEAGARQYLQRFSDDVVGHQQVLPTRITRLAKLPWLSCWEQQLAAEKKSAHTVRAYLIAARKLAATPLPEENELEGDEIRNFSVEQMHVRLDPNNGRLDLWLQSLASLRASTISARIAAATHLLKWLGHRIPDWVTRPQKSKRLPRTLNRDELSKLLKTSKESENPLAEVVVVVLLETGMRVSELCGLDECDVDLTDLSANVYSGKGDKDRVVLFTSRARESIERWLRHRITMKKRVENALFVNSRGNRLTDRNVQKMMDVLADAAGIPRNRLSPHTLRHNFATGLLERGADLVSIQRLLGHTNISTTRVYLDISDQTLRQVYRRAQDFSRLEEMFEDDDS